MEQNSNGHVSKSNSNDSDGNSDAYENAIINNPYDGVKVPTPQFVSVMIIENPSPGPSELAALIRHRMKMRFYFPNKFKSAALALGEVYLQDELEEYRMDMLDETQKQRLRMQRSRRNKKGTVSVTSYDKEKAYFIMRDSRIAIAVNKLLLQKNTAVFA